MFRLLFLVFLVSVTASVNERSLMNTLNPEPSQDCLVHSHVGSTTNVFNKCSFPVEAYVHCFSTSRPMMFKKCYLRSGPVGYFALNYTCTPYFSRRFVEVPQTIFNNCSEFNPEAEAAQHAINDDTAKEALPDKHDL